MQCKECDYEFPSSLEKDNMELVHMIDKNGLIYHLYKSSKKPNPQPKNWCDMLCEVFAFIFLLILAYLIACRQH